MKIGDIVVNEWASVDNPLRKGIYMGNWTLVSVVDGKIRRSRYDRSMLSDEHFKVVGHVPIIEILSDALK